MAATRYFKCTHNSYPDLAKDLREHKHVQILLDSMSKQFHLDVAKKVYNNFMLPSDHRNYLEVSYDGLGPMIGHEVWVKYSLVPIKRHNSELLYLLKPL